MTIEERDTMRAIQNMDRKAKDHTKPDWEQRRYEIVKDVAARWLTHPDIEVRKEVAFNSEHYIEGAIMFANTLVDALIEENLKHPLR